MRIKKTLIITVAFLIIIAGTSLIFTNPIFAQGPPECPPGKLCNPFSGSFDSLTDFINFILEKIVLPIGAVVAVFFIIFSGFLFVTAQGNEEKLAKAKKAFLWTAVGVLILLGSVVISKGIAETICQIGNVPGLCPPGSP